MTTWQLIRAMLQKGYQLEAGPHLTGLQGYWARFIPVQTVDSPKYGERALPVFCQEGWHSAGHAMSAHCAVVMAAKLALGKQVTIPLLSEFES